MIGQLPDQKRNIMRFSWAAAGVVFLCGLFALGQPAPYEGAVTMGEITLPEVPKDSEPPEAVSPAAKYGALTVYKVEAGDSLYWIATTYGLSVEELKDLNNLESDVIRVGQRLLVPLDQVKYYPVGVRLTSQEVEWLAQMIHAEARGEPYLGQVAVGAVIINRILSPQFPDTLRGVLFQTNAFQPIQNGSFYMAPNETARRAALEALSGHDPTGGALFFFNPRKSTDRFMHSRPVQTTIGNHRFTM
ncbi:MAG: LysM peptidoglycan-binding domain-containing protein [Firmicutes bacterium]|nr:cell wall hydrolase [Bacillota bacterium]NLL09187.1 LysM peptidoglycan-binding domain-containing protein [Bacillota bacterium]